MTVAFRQRLDNGETLEDVLVEAFALVREAAWRVLGQRHFDAQLMGGMALHFGWIAEMKTGEGKTLVSTLPVYLNALAGNGVHVVTVNDYLATRDSEWMGRLHRFLGLTVGRVGPDISDPAEKREAYSSDVTYGTNTEFGFDYLRDNMARSKDAMVQRGHHFAIIDEVDSILIDEARTPAHHLRAGRRVGPALLPVRRHRPHPAGRGRLRGRRGEADHRADRGRHREGRAPARRGQPVRRGGRQLRAPPDPGPPGQGAVQARQGLPGRPRRGPHRRRVHRAHPRRPPLVRRPPPGRRGQGAGEDQRGEPHLGHGDPPELLPPLREARRHDRHRRDRGLGVRQHLRAAGGPDPAQPSPRPRPTSPT